MPLYLPPQIREILKATHLQTAEAVKGKLTALMKQVRHTRLRVRRIT